MINKNGVIAAAILAVNVLAINAYAQQDMMQAMQKMQSCLAKVDMQQLEALSQRTQNIEAELKALCQQGNHQQAGQLAMRFGMEISNHPEMKKMQACTKDVGQMAMNMMPNIPDYSQQSAEDAEHFCDRQL